MAAKHVDTIRQLALENGHLRDVLNQAEQMHLKATGASLRASLGLDELWAPLPPESRRVSKAPSDPEKPASVIKAVIPFSVESINKTKAPPLAANPANYRLGAYPLTDEQQSSVDKAVTGESLKIEAGAGSGKTSNLTAISHNLAHLKGLYLAFNQSIIKDAKSRFHQNTECRTTHSLAFSFVGSHYSHRLQKKTIASKMIIDALGLRDWHGISMWAQANIIRQWVVNFTQSDLPVLTNKVAPWRAISLLTKQGDKQKAYLESQPIASYLGPFAARLWEMLRDVNGTLHVWPDIYLKAWALTNPILHSDYILLDEAQDTNAVTLKIVQDQPCQVIWVGDRRQQIYAWRGAVNAMDAITTTHTSQLTRSFRYGQPIAEMANRVLEHFLGEKSFRIVGSSMVESQLCEVSNPKMILCRGNRGAMKELMEALREGKRVHMAGDVSNMITEVEACMSLMKGQRPKRPDFQMFNTWNELIEYSESEAGAELQALVKLLKLWPAEDLLVALNAVHNVEQADADVSISTTHKAKGLEADSVRLADDFSFPPSDIAKPDIPFSEEEARILYVALTRAKYQLDISQCRAAQVALNWKSQQAPMKPT